MRRRILPIVLLTCITLLALAGAAFAHAQLRTAEPAPDAALREAPDQVLLRFTYPVRTRPNSIAIYDQQGIPVQVSPAEGDPADPTLARTSFAPLPDGIFTVVWQVWGDDGHPMAGSYSFIVGDVEPGAQPFEAPEPEAAAPALDQLLGYWLATGGLMLLAGLGLTQRLVVGEDGDPRYVRWLRIALVGAALGLFLVLWGREDWRLGSWALTILALSSLALPRYGHRWWAGALVGAAGLVPLALDGHAATLPYPALSVTLSWLHLLAAGAWAGGLVQFAFLIPAQERLGLLVQRFTPVAALSVGVLVLSGLYPAFWQLPALDSLWTSDYGQTLTIKLGLTIPLLIFGAANLFGVGPRLRQGQKLHGTLRRLVIGEVALMAAVLGAAMLLSNQQPPGREFLVQAPGFTVLNVGKHTVNYGFIFKMTPLAPGRRTLDVIVRPHEGTIGEESRVSFYLLRIEPQEVLPARRGEFIGDDRFRFENIELSEGLWEFQVEVERPGYEPELVAIPVEVPPAR